MSGPRPRNLPASLHRRLLNLARERGDEFEMVLTHFAIERLLFRLAQSAHAERFLLKGAMLMAVWTGRPHRPTRDLDLAGRGDSSVAAMEAVFRELCGQRVPEDGMTYDAGLVRGELIRQDQEYEGVRIHLVAALGKARIALQVDIGIGDPVVPGPQVLTYPTLLGHPAPRMAAYPPETVVAEKVEAMATLGPVNSRMKDFYDLWLIGHRFDFDGAVLARAIAATFSRRGTPFPHGPLYALTDAFVHQPEKQNLWNAFVSRGRLQERPASLHEVVTFLRPFVMPPILAACEGWGFDQRWRPGGPWQ